MGDGSLSQEEIDALLMGADDMGGGAAFAPPSGGGGASASSGSVSPSEKDIITEILNEAMSVVGRNTSSLLDGKTVNIQCAGIDEINAAQIPQEIQPGSAVVSLNMGRYSSLFVFPADLARKISMVMLGQPSEPFELDDAHLSTLSELVNHLAGSLSNSVGPKFGDDLTPQPPEVRVINSTADVPKMPEANAAKITYSVSIEGFPGSRIVQYISGSALNTWASSVRKDSPSAKGGGAFDLDFGGGGGGDFGGGGGGGFDFGGSAVNPVNYPSLQRHAAPASVQLPPNFDLLLDVQMVLTVELGRTKKYVKEILGLGEGSIIELDKLAGEPVDLLINGKLIAKGEVVVIDENFGVRVTDIVGPAERLAKMTAG